jgi:hypothetical protein
MNTADYGLIFFVLFCFSGGLLLCIVFFNHARRNFQKRMANFLLVGPIEHEITILLKTLQANRNCNAPLKHLEVLVASYMALAGHASGVANLNNYVEALQRGMETNKKYSLPRIFFGESREWDHLDLCIGNKTCSFDLNKPVSSFDSYSY